MEYLNRLEWLIRTNTRYAGDEMYVCKKEKESLHIASIGELGNRSSIICRKILEVICAGGDIITDEYVIDDTNRKAYYELFLSLYKTERKYIDKRRRDGIQKASAQGNYKGRTRIKIDKLELNEIFDAYEKEKITGKDAATKLQISLSTFYRRYHEYKQSQLSDK